MTAKCYEISEGPFVGVLGPSHAGAVGAVNVRASGWVSWSRSNT